MKGISLKSLELYTLVFLFRLISILQHQGYLPFDKSGDWFYHVIEIVGFLGMYITYIVLLHVYVVYISYTLYYTYEQNKPLVTLFYIYIYISTHVYRYRSSCSLHLWSLYRLVSGESRSIWEFRHWYTQLFRSLFCDISMFITRLTSASVS